MRKSLPQRFYVGLLIAATGVALVLMPLTPSVKITWQTATEVNTVGFNIYRSEHGATPALVNGNLIPAKGNPLTGASYAFEDKSVKPFHKYEYSLEEVERNGESNPYPRTVVATTGPPPLPFRAAGSAAVFVGAFLTTRELVKTTRRSL